MSPRGSTSGRRAGSCCARSRSSGGRGRSPGGSAAGSCCASRDAPYSIRSWPAGPGRRAGGLVRRAGGRPVLDGGRPGGPGARGGGAGRAVLGGHGAGGNFLVVRQEFVDVRGTARVPGGGPAVVPRAGPAALVTA